MEMILILPQLLPKLLPRVLAKVLPRKLLRPLPTSPNMDTAKLQCTAGLPALRGRGGQYAGLAGQTLVSDSGTRFHVRDVIGDGRCLFRALAVHLFNSEHAFQNVINKCVAFLCNHWAELGIFVQTCHAGYGDASSIQSYQAYMQYGFAFGTTAEILGVAGAFEVHITVINEAGQWMMMCTVHMPKPLKTKPPHSASFRPTCPARRPTL